MWLVLRRGLIWNYLNFLLVISRLNYESVSFWPILFNGFILEKFDVVYLMEIPSDMSSSWEKLLAKRAARVYLNISWFFSAYCWRVAILLNRSYNFSLMMVVK